MMTNIYYFGFYGIRNLSTAELGAYGSEFLKRLQWRYWLGIQSC